MNLNNLFEIQDKLDKHIVKEKSLEGQDLLDKKILALQVELGELANEWRGFKFWSKDQEPNLKCFCKACDGFGTREGLDIDWQPYQEPCEYCGGKGAYGNPLLEEYVDCLHFILSIGLETELKIAEIKPAPRYYRDTTFAFNQVFNDVAAFGSIEYAERNNLLGMDDLKQAYEELLGGFLRLGQLLGFSWEQIEVAYMQKNEINYARQENGY
ncbi:dUTP diphosphatase [Oceanobacillus indicireducens]|uniref:dUTPase n=1 Tax=Oceanobacillus indicireducens TaxID=1004261 RepID=A0A917Y471_9BACI|nr:dUTP diphosphatase [Oceanobacillus indicireducens]GGN64397.1 hypothetical protein GCM10007971_32240 [Oceanobacillus indicireducens]